VIIIRYGTFLGKEQTMSSADSGKLTRLKLGEAEEISDGRLIRWLELPFGEQPFWVPVNLLPDDLEQGDYVALRADETTEKRFEEQRNEFT
jgi:hypothetical protein